MGEKTKKKKTQEVSISLSIRIGKTWLTFRMV